MEIAHHVAEPRLRVRWCHSAQSLHNPGFEFGAVVEGGVTDVVLDLREGVFDWIEEGRVGREEEIFEPICTKKVECGVDGIGVVDGGVVEKQKCVCRKMVLEIEEEEPKIIRVDSTLALLARCEELEEDYPGSAERSHEGQVLLFRECCQLSRFAP